MRKFFLLAYLLTTVSVVMAMLPDNSPNRPILRNCVIWGVPVDNSWETLVARARVVSDIFYRESLPLRPTGRFRESIATTTNIARLAVHVSFSDDSIVTVYDEVAYEKDKYSKVCYLSGNKETKFGQRPPLIVRDYGFVSLCRVPEYAPSMLIVQRTQPNPIIMEKRIAMLADAAVSDIFLGDSSVIPFVAESQKKKPSISAVKEKCTEIINQIDQDIKELESQASSPLFRHNITIMKETKRCLETSDYGFVTFDDSPKGLKAVAEDYIKSIKEELYKGFTEDVLFNSKKFNLGCSEQLLTDYVFSRQTSRVAFANRVKQIIKTSEKDPIRLLLQVDTTKAPCEACIVDIMLNTVNGNIKSFLESISEIKDKKVAITYSEPYDSKYSFSVLPFSNYFDTLKEKKTCFPVMFIVPSTAPILFKFQKLKRELQETTRYMELMGIRKSEKPSFIEIAKHIYSMCDSKPQSETESILIEYAQDQEFVDFVLENTETKKKDKIRQFLGRLASSVKEVAEKQKRDVLKKVELEELFRILGSAVKSTVPSVSGVKMKEEMDDLQTEKEPNVFGIQKWLTNNNTEKNMEAAFRNFLQFLDKEQLSKSSAGIITSFNNFWRQKPTGKEIVPIITDFEKLERILQEEKK